MARRRSFGYTSESFSPLFLPLLGASIVLYMLFGAFVFSKLEGPREEEDIAEFRREIVALAEAQNITLDQLKAILHKYDELKTSGFLSEDLETERRVKWDFSGGFAFVGAVVTTMGFGYVTPMTRGARLFYVIFCLLGCSAVFLFFNTWLVRFIAYFNRICLWARNMTQRMDDDKKNNEDFKASPGHVLLALSAMTLVILLISSAIYDAAEKDWDFLDSLYYCFTAFSTIGFGDFVSGQAGNYTEIDRYLYNVLDAVLLTFGCCCVHSCFNLISFFIKKFIEGIIKRVSQFKKDEDKLQGDLVSLGMSEAHGMISNSVDRRANHKANHTLKRSRHKYKLPESAHGLYEENENVVAEIESLQGDRCVSFDLGVNDPAQFRGDGLQAERPSTHQSILSAPVSSSFQHNQRSDVRTASASSVHRPLGPKVTEVKMNEILGSELLTKAKLEIYIRANGTTGNEDGVYKGLHGTSGTPVHNCIERYEIPGDVLHSLSQGRTSAGVLFEVRRIPAYSGQVTGWRRMVSRAEQSPSWVENSDVFPLSIMKNEMR